LSPGGLNVGRGPPRVRDGVDDVSVAVGVFVSVAVGVSVAVSVGVAVVSVGVGVSVAVSVGVGVSVAVRVGSGALPTQAGFGKDSTSMPSMAAFMKTVQIRTGYEPPVISRPA
jgi:hypothetical protein